MPGDPEHSGTTGAEIPGAASGEPKINYDRLAEAIAKSTALSAMVTGAVDRRASKLKDTIKTLEEKIAELDAKGGEGSGDGKTGGEDPSGSGGEGESNNPQMAALEEKLKLLTEKLTKSETGRAKETAQRLSIETDAALRKAAHKITKPDFFVRQARDQVVRQDDGTFVVCVGLDDLGDKKYVSLEDHAGKFLEENPELAPARSEIGGSGAGGESISDGSGGEITLEQFASLPIEKMNAFLNTHGVGGTRHKSGEIFDDSSLTTEEIGGKGSSLFGRKE